MKMKTTSIFFQRGAGATMVVILVILVVIFILGMSYLNYMKSEARLTTRMLQNTTAAYLSEAAIDEAVLHVRKRMNEPGDDWYEIFRKPVSELENNPVTKDFSPVETRNFVAGSACNVTITFEKVTRFKDDPAPDPDGLEKCGALKFVSKVKLGNAEVSVEVKKDVKVVSLAIPAPLDNYTLWLREGEGSAGSRKIAGPDAFSGTTPVISLDSVNPGDADYEKISNWQYTLSGEDRDNYPLCKQKASYLFNDLEDYRKYFHNGNIYKLSGDTVIHSILLPSLSSPLELNGRMVGNGKLIFTGHVVRLDNLVVDGTLHLVVLRKLSPSLHCVELDGYAGTPFSGTIAVPDGAIVSSDSAKVSGSVYAKYWFYKPGNTIEFSQPNGYLVTLSEQIISWKRNK